MFFLIGEASLAKWLPEIIDIKFTQNQVEFMCRKCNSKFNRHVINLTLFSGIMITKVFLSDN